MSEGLLLMVLLSGGAAVVALAYSVGRQVGRSGRDGRQPDARGPAPEHPGWWGRERGARRGCDCGPLCDCGQEWWREDAGHGPRGPHGR